MSPKLTAVGFWMNSSDPDLLDPTELVSATMTDDDVAVVQRHLVRGVVCEAFRGFSWCRFECGVGDEQMGDRELTDGVWCWPEGLAHYVSVHRVRLMRSFVEHVRRRASLRPSLDVEAARALHRRGLDYGAWQAWGVERNAALDLGAPWVSLMHDPSAADAVFQYRLERLLGVDDALAPLRPAMPHRGALRVIARRKDRNDVLVAFGERSPRRLARVRVDWNAIARGESPRSSAHFFETWREWNASRAAGGDEHE